MSKRFTLDRRTNINAIAQIHPPRRGSDTCGPHYPQGSRVAGVDRVRYCARLVHVPSVWSCGSGRAPQALPRMSPHDITDKLGNGMPVEYSSHHSERSKADMANLPCLLVAACSPALLCARRIVAAKRCPFNLMLGRTVSSRARGNLSRRPPHPGWIVRPNSTSAGQQGALRGPLLNRECE